MAKYMLIMPATDESFANFMQTDFAEILENRVTGRTGEFAPASRGPRRPARPTRPARPARPARRSADRAPAGRQLCGSAAERAVLERKVNEFSRP
jgi:hypothetical protein